MRKNRLLIIVLHRIFVISFWGFVIFFLFVVSNKLYPHQFTFGDSWVPKEPEGFALPIDFQLSIPDSIVSYHASDSLGLTSGITMLYSKDDHPIDEADKKIDSLRKLPGVQKQLIHNELTFYSGTQVDTIVQHTDSNIRLKGSMTIKSSNAWIDGIIKIVQHLNIVLAILILYQLKGIFFLLKRSLSFDIKIIQRVTWLGLILIISELMNASQSYYISRLIDYIDISSYDNGSTINNGLRTQIYPMITFEWSIFIVGCSLLVLSTLLRQGNILETENELTI